MDIGALFKAAWAKFTEHAAPLVLATIVTMAAPNIVSYVLGKIPGVGGFLGMIVGGTLSIFLGMGLTSMALDVVDGKSPELPQLFETFKARQVDYLVTGVLVASGAILCGVGAIVTSFLFLLAPVMVIDGRGWNEALRASYEAVTEDFGTHALLWLVCVGLVMVGAMAFGIGALVTVPLSLLVLTSFYRERTAPRVIEAEVG
ncbi:MAG: hypothetical protein GXY23_01350 [Myxococcales bacterium]|nr:hypothetical protein [Myxococcales bacterium]